MVVRQDATENSRAIRESVGCASFPILSPSTARPYSCVSVPLPRHRPQSSTPMHDIAELTSVTAQMPLAQSPPQLCSLGVGTPEGARNTPMTSRATIQLASWKNNNLSFLWRRFGRISSTLAEHFSTPLDLEGRKPKQETRVGATAVSDIPIQIRTSIMPGPRGLSAVLCHCCL